MKYFKKLIKISKSLIISVLICSMLANNVCAEELEYTDFLDESNVIDLDKNNIDLNKELPAKEKPEEKQEEIPKFEKPDICGQIIFDPTLQDVPITLKEVLSIVLDKNFDIKIFLQRKNRDKWRYYQTITDWLPDLTSGFLLSRADGTFVVGGVDVVKVIESPFEMNFFFYQNINVSKYFNLKEAFYNLNSAKRELEFSKDEALLEASRRYYELLRQKIDIDIHKIHVKQIEEQFKINKQRVESGAGTEFDVLRAEADRDNAIQSLLKAKNSYRLAQAQLANVLGLPVFIQFVPDENDVLVKDIIHDCFTLERANAIALNSRDDLAASRFDIKAAKVRKDAGYSIYFPDVNLIGQYADQGTLQIGIFPARRLTFIANWNGPTSLGLKGYTEIKARKAELEERKLLYITQARNVQQNIVRAFADCITTRQLIESTFLELEAASKTREIALIRLQEEIGPFIDVIQTQIVFTSARIDNFDAIIGNNISQIDLLFEMGVISPENIIYGFDSGTLKRNYNSGKTAEFNKKIRKNLEILKAGGRYEGAIKLEEDETEPEYETEE